jgi:hypothetical protein
MQTPNQTAGFNQMQLAQILGNWCARGRQARILVTVGSVGSSTTGRREEQGLPGDGARGTVDTDSILHISVPTAYRSRLKLQPYPSSAAADLSLQMNLMSTSKADGPGDDGWSYHQEDNGAAMHLAAGLKDFVIGHTDQINISAGTARKDDKATKLDIVGPLLRVFQGVNGHGKQMLAVQYIGIGAADTKHQWAQLMSHNGIVRERMGQDGDERLLDNTIDNSANTVTFGASQGKEAIVVQMKRVNRGSFIRSRPPTPTAQRLKPSSETTHSFASGPLGSSCLVK